MKSVFLSSSAIVFALAVSGCATQVPQKLSATYVPSNFTAPTTANAAVWPQADWWKGFGSDELNGFVDTAQKDNLDLTAAMAQVLQAEANAEIAGSALFPQISGSGGVTRARTPSGQSLLGKSSTSNSSNVGVSGTWALDIWGEAQDNLRAA